MAQTVFTTPPSTPFHSKDRPRSLLLGTTNLSSKTRITTKYKLLSPPKPKNTDATDSDAAPATAANYTPRATLALKTYDPVSGVCLKYRTDKGAEVGRLIATLGRLGRHMAALPETAEPVDDAVVEPPQDAAMTTEQTELTTAPAKGTPAAKDAGAAGKKKKKGKK